MPINDAYLVKLKQAKIADEIIAGKLGISIQQVNERWEEILRQVMATEMNGHGELINHFNVLCHQYQLLGESLKIFGKAICNIVPQSELLGLLKEGSTVQQMVATLSERCIILRPFVPLTPQESLEQSIKDN